jgi:DMSO/TMAO reductase YedYZ molybdopterin-dependent catalytic subunit
MIHEEKDNSYGSEDISSTGTRPKFESVKLQPTGSEEPPTSQAVVGETHEDAKPIEQPQNADGSPSSPVGHAVRADEAPSSTAVNQETGPENAAHPTPKGIEKSEIIEATEQPAHEAESPTLSADHEPQMGAEAPAAVKSAAVKTPSQLFGEDVLPIIEASPRVLRYRTRRDLMLFGAGAMAAVVGSGLLLPQATLDRIGVQRKINPRGKEWLLNKALRIDDDVAEALYSPHRMVPTYTRSQITPIKNNYNGATPDPAYISGWNLTLEGLDSGLSVCLDIRKLLNHFPMHEQITGFVCVEGWTAIAWWAGLRFDDLLHAYPPISQAKWARVESSVNLDNSGNPDPYFVSIDLATARHFQTLLVTHHNGQPLTVEHGAPLRLLVPVKLGLKNVKAITRITYSAKQPRDYWEPYGYSSYDGI